MDLYELSEREKSILRYVIHQFILTANPVGSRNISKKYNIGLSPATIRNIMSDLEDSGFLGHPHTSAGRVPTDKGYRFYVDSLMDIPMLGKIEKRKIDTGIEKGTSETDELLKVTSLILSDITNQLACITYPRFDSAVLERIQILQLSSTRLLVVISVLSGIVKTITLELDVEINFDKVSAVERILNEKLSGLKFSEIRDTFEERVKNYLTDDYKPIIRLFIDSADKLFKDIKVDDKSVVTGARNILKQPEFEDHGNLHGIIELIENKEIVVHIMDRKIHPINEDVQILIGSENEEEKLSDYSMITKEYKFGEVHGTVGIVGPKRMEYSKIVASVDYIAEMLSKELKKKNL
ncbi:MAG: heat-inducible transcription repressor HrcA [Ignavibacteria bacterium GWB2_35_6b]|nr:MAG: heat-inducible transcription repressor HrcA [Ignavibacteria bacterium GWB2_35_6b]